LDAHPAQEESDVSLRICSRDIRFTSSPNVFAASDGGSYNAIENRQSKIENG
jgi:hypothetical protein